MWQQPHSHTTCTLPSSSFPAHFFARKIGKSSQTLAGVVFYYNVPVVKRRSAYKQFLFYARLHSRARSRPSAFGMISFVCAGRDSANARRGTRKEAAAKLLCGGGGGGNIFSCRAQSTFYYHYRRQWRIRDEKSERARARRLQMRWLVDFESRAHFLSLTTADVDVMLAKSCSHASFFVSIVYMFLHLKLYNF